MQKILIIDDDISTTESIGTYLEELGYSTMTACNVVDALEIIKRYNPDLIICDLSMPKLGGVELSYILKGMNFTNPLIFISGKDSGEKILDKLEFYAFVRKPIDIFELSGYVEKALAS